MVTGNSKRQAPKIEDPVPVVLLCLLQYSGIFSCHRSAIEELGVRTLTPRCYTNAVQEQMTRFTRINFGGLYFVFLFHILVLPYDPQPARYLNSIYFDELVPRKPIGKEPQENDKTCDCKSRIKKIPPTCCIIHT